MNANKVRNTFFEFFKSKQHKIVSSAPMVVKNDPTLMFTNAGMNQFKDIFLGNNSPVALRVANTQKCLRVSGKHNDLDEVGHDTYHHTMFEMLGNWSFGDYFKKEAIAWAWELLTEVYGIKKENLYVTVFGGDKGDGLDVDMEAYNYWKEIIPEDQILHGSKKDNFWEMGESGPCGPCSEIHVDLRDESEKLRIPGAKLVNEDHPEVIEIWNLVFVEFNRKSDGSLHQLPAKHVDTGMGFERLCMVLQGKKSNYDTDNFQFVIQHLAKISGIKYGDDIKTDIAMRVIADGQLPSNVKAGYVIRRILRRAIRYGYTFLNLNEPFMFELVPSLVEKMGDVFPEIEKQQDLIRKVIMEEEIAFLRTLALGIKKFDSYIEANPGQKTVDGKFAFELFDTFGFPVDLTRIMAEEKGWDVDIDGFNKGLELQKERSRSAAAKDVDDWVIVDESVESSKFVGYDYIDYDSKITRYRKVKEKKNEFFQLVLDKTPFYAESGGQVGDRGYIQNGNTRIEILDTKKENDLIVHIVKKLPEDINEIFTVVVDGYKRQMTMNNHSATHLMHAALRTVLGDHVEQKGSLVNEKHLRFDFSHFSKLTDQEILSIEKLVNEKIRENIEVNEKRHVPMVQAQKMGAMALFGEKYGDDVRVITFDPDYSVELCGGTHVPATGQIGFFKITSEGAIAAGIRRIEAITADKAEEFIFGQAEVIDELKTIFKSQKDIIKCVQTLIDQNNQLKKQIDGFNAQKADGLKDELINQIEKIGDINFLAKKVELDAGGVRDLAFKLNKEIDNMFLVLGSAKDGKAGITIMISENLVKEKGLNAGTIIREVAKEIQGGGGGQPHFATAGGKNPNGIEKALAKAREILER